MVNTKISYLYRDAGNYKMPNEAVVAGTVSECQISIIIDCLDEGLYFIPGQVGLPEERFGRWTRDDHCWFELQRCGFEATGEAPTVNMTVGGLVGKFLEAKGNWREDTNGHG